MFCGLSINGFELEFYARRKFMKEQNKWCKSHNELFMSVKW